ncbi:MAG: EamA family transporter [Anaerolineae bacterium]|nr:EamA family transporter [Anaerolineae bacterium]
MSPLVLAVLLLSAAMHTAWNGWMKGSGNKLAYHWAGLVAAIVIYAIPVALTTPLALPRAAWPVLAGSALCEVGYMVCITRAYTRGEMSLVYPMSRGSAPLWIAAGGLVMGVPLPWAGYLGVALLVMGIYVVSLPSWGNVHQPLRSLAQPGAGWALAAGICIAGYSSFDKVGVTLVPPAAYNLWTFIAMTVAALPAVWRLEGPSRVVATVRAERWRVVLGGLFVMGTYFLVLWALARAPASYVTAVRSFSILFGAVWAARVLHERFGTARAVGAALAVAGLVVIAVAG